MPFLRSLLLLLVILACAASVRAQLPGTWEKIYICDTCYRPFAIFADEDAVLVLKGDISTAPPKAWGMHYTTYASLDTGTTWKEAKVYTEYIPLEPSNFNVTNFFAPNPTDDRRGRKPTCTTYCTSVNYGGGQIFASFNSGTNWDHTLHYTIGEAATYKMFGASNGYLIAHKSDRDTFKFTGHVITDTGFTYSPATFKLNIRGHNEFNKLPLLADGIIWDRQVMNLFIIKDSITTLYKTTNGGNSWASLPFAAGIGPIRPIAQGYKSGRMIGIRRKATNDLMVTDNYGATWDTLGPHTDRAMYVHEPAENQMWLLAARSSVFPQVNLFDLRATAQVDTLYFSSDQGKTWQQDLTFAGDTICAMAWATPRLGYVLGKRDGRTYVARFIPNRKLDVAPTFYEEYIHVSAHPNPFEKEISLISDRTAEALITVRDILGNELLSMRVQLIAQEPLAIELPVVNDQILILTAQFENGDSPSIKLIRSAP
jgi:hypothetical protein